LRSQTTVVVRWLAIPTASTVVPSQPDASAMVLRAADRTEVATEEASPSMKEGAGEETATGSLWTWLTVPSGSTIDARTLELPTSTTRMLMAFSDREVVSRPADLAERRGNPQLSGIEDSPRIQDTFERLE
jgi:hypothetical protein